MKIGKFVKVKKNDNGKFKMILQGRIVGLTDEGAYVRDMKRGRHDTTPSEWFPFNSKMLRVE